MTIRPRIKQSGITRLTNESVLIFGFAKVLTKFEFLIERISSFWRRRHSSASRSNTIHLFQLQTSSIRYTYLITGHVALIFREQLSWAALNTSVVNCLNVWQSVVNCRTGADEAIAPVVKCGYFMRNHVDSNPPYDPPNVMTGRISVFTFVLSNLA